jgi:hypothetical protein
MAPLCRHPLSGTPGRTLLVFVTVPALLVFVEHALGDRVQANWLGLLYPACAIAAASLTWPASSEWRWKGAAGFGLLLTLLVYVQSTLAAVSLPHTFDITLTRLAGWRSLAGAVAARSTPSGFIMADEYGLASELAFAMPGRGVLAAEPRWRLFALPHPDVAGRTGLLLRTSRHREAPDPRLFSSSVSIGEVQRGRAGRVAETYRLYRVTVRADLPAMMCDQVVRLP